jgi:hypothetical protein
MQKWEGNFYVELNRYWPWWRWEKCILLCCRKILNPRIILLDCPLEYKKGESQVCPSFRIINGYFFILKNTWLTPTCFFFIRLTWNWRRKKILRECWWICCFINHLIDNLCILFPRRALQLEEEFVKQMCDEIIAMKPDLIFTEKGVSGRMILKSISSHIYSNLSLKTINI